MDPVDLLAWAQLAAQAAALGVTTWERVEALLADAGVPPEAADLLAARWEAQVAEAARLRARH